MKNQLILILCFCSTASSAGWFDHDNYWECLLDKLENVQTDTVAKEAVELCKEDYPFYERTFVEKKKPWFGVKSADECVIKHGKHTQSEVAARYIQSACYKLYPDT